MAGQYGANMQNNQNNFQDSNAFDKYAKGADLNMKTTSLKATQLFKNVGELMSFQSRMNDYSNITDSR